LFNQKLFCNNTTKIIAKKNPVNQKTAEGSKKSCHPVYLYHLTELLIP